MKLLKAGLLLLLTFFATAVFAQKGPGTKHKTNNTVYACPMHPEVTANKPGACSKCGMDLERVKKVARAKIWVCPMHPEQTASKPGKCSKCHMPLTEKKS